MNLKLKKSPAKSRPPKLPKVTSSWQLFRAALIEVRQGYKLYLKIIAVVLVPGALLTWLGVLGGTTQWDAYATVVVIIMNLALLWAIISRQQSGRYPSLGQAYHIGTASMVSYSIINLLLLLMLIPAAFGVALYVVAAVAITAVGSSGAELVVFGLLGLVLALPTGYLIVRFLLALVIAAAGGVRPVAALRRSHRATHRRFWPAAGRIVMLLVFLLVALIPVFALTFGLSYLPIGRGLAVFFQIAVTITVLPVACVYLVNLLTALEQGRSTPVSQLTNSGSEPAA